MILENVKVMWAAIHKPNEMSGKYQMDITGLSKEAVKELKGLGVDVKEGGKEDKAQWGHWVTAKSNYALKPELLVSKSKQLMPDGTELGNGSVCNVAVHTFDWTFKTKKGTSVGFDAVQVLELVEFSSAAVGEFPQLEEPSEECSSDGIPF